MTDFRERYKRAGFGREDMSANRALRSIRRDEARREMRDEQFSFLRRDFETAQNDSLDVPENHHRQEHHEQHEERGEEEDRHEDTKSKATTGTFAATDVAGGRGGVIRFYPGYAGKVFL